MKAFFYSLFFILFYFSKASAHAHQYEERFWMPFYRGYPLDYCLSDRSTCGLKVANHYCRFMGLLKAMHYRVAYHLEETQYFGTALRCKNNQCNGFKVISCLGDVPFNPSATYHYRKRHFPFPRYKGQRIDWCAKAGKTGCGHQAAYSFCRRLGFMKSMVFSPESKLLTTTAIDDQWVCTGTNCTGFKYIDCYR